MDKNIKKLISEAFNELYEEMVNEAPATLKKNKITDNEVQALQQKAVETGRGFTWDETADDNSKNNFNLIVDYLINYYKGDEKSIPGWTPQKKENAKKAIISALAPSKEGGRGNKMYRLAGEKFITDPDLEDAEMSAFDQVLLADGAFEKLISNYDTNSRGFSARVLSAMKNRINNYIYRGHGEGISSFDPLGGGRRSAGKSMSMDVEKEDGHGFHDTYAGPDSKESAMDISKRDAQTKMQLKMLKSLNNWLSDKKIPERTFIAVTELLNGTQAKTIESNHPEIDWTRLPTTLFNDFKKSTLAQEASKFISDLFKVDFNMANIDPNKLAQQSAQSGEYNPSATDNEIGSREMLDLLGEINKAIADAGFSFKANFKITTDIPSENNIKNYAESKFQKSWDELSKEEKKSAISEAGWSKLRKVFDKLEGEGKFDEIDNLKWLVQDLESAKEKDEAAGGYGSKRTYIHKDDDSGKDYGGMFEGIPEKDVDKLMERVLRRLSK